MPSCRLQHVGTWHVSRLCWVVFQVAPRIKAMMMEQGNAMVGYQPLGNLPNFFRIVLTNPCLSTEDVDFFLDETARLGEK